MNDRETYEKLVAENYELIYKYCCVKLGFDDHAATEVTNDTFVVFGEKFDELELSGNVAGWLIKTAQNRILKYNEREARYKSRVILPEDDGVFERIEDDSPGVEESVIAKLSESEALRLIERSLDEDALELFRRHYIDEENPTAIAAALDLPYTTTRMRLKRLEAKLRRLLSPDVESDRPIEPRKRGRPRKKRD